MIPDSLDSVCSLLFFLWEFKFLVVHAIANSLVLLSCLVISAVCLFVYRNGQFQGVKASFPVLWILGGLFTVLFGISQFYSFIEVWTGNLLHWLVGLKVIMAVVSVSFAGQLWKNKDTMALFGRVLKRVHDASDTDKWE